MSLVSVIIPVYNREATIKASIESVLKQTYQNFELIVVDDCSKDGSVKVVEDICDNRVKVISCEKNGGACVARNIGINAAKGDIIAFHDSDDIWKEDKLEKSMYYLHKEHADMVFSAVYRKGEGQYGEGGRIVPTYNLNQVRDKLSRLLVSNCVSTQTIVVKREVLEKVRFDKRFPRFQDWDFAMQVLQKGFKVYYIDEPLVECMVLEDSITKDAVKAIKALKLFEKKYESEFRKNKESACMFYHRAAVFLEDSGYNGALYFKKAYHMTGNKGMFFRYVLAKLKLYKLSCSVYIKLNHKNGRRN